MVSAIGLYLRSLPPLTRKLMLVVLLALLALAGAQVFASKDDGGGAGANSPDPLSVLAARSPGARQGGMLIKTKRHFTGPARKHRAPAADLPSERVLSTVRTRPTAAGPIAPLVAAPDLAFLDVPAGLGVPGIVGPASGLPTAFDVPTIGFGEFPGIATAPLPPPGAGPAPPPGGSPTAPPAVPEPATWLLLIIGIGTAGALVRRERDRSRAPEAMSGA